MKKEDLGKKDQKGLLIRQGLGSKYGCVSFFVAHQGKLGRKERSCVSASRLHPWNTNLMIFNNSSIVVLAYPMPYIDPTCLHQTKAKSYILEIQNLLTTGSFAQ